VPVLKPGDDRIAAFAPMTTREPTPYFF
jgi:hypothetical protein